MLNELINFDSRFASNAFFSAINFEADLVDLFPSLIVTAENSRNFIQEDGLQEGQIVIKLFFNLQIEKCSKKGITKGIKFLLLFIRPQL